MKEKRQIPLGVGISSILLIFVILCLLTFAVLSLVSANTDYKLVQKNSSHTHEIYEAENSANEFINQIDSVLEATYQSTASSQYLEAVKGNLSTFPEFTFLSDNQLSFAIKVNETQNLQVVLTLNSEIKKGDFFYQIDTWKLVNTNTWEPDATLPVYTGEN